jgi:hypothetical protein
MAILPEPPKLAIVRCGATFCRIATAATGLYEGAPPWMILHG